MPYLLSHDTYPFSQVVPKVVLGESMRAYRIGYQGNLVLVHQQANHNGFPMDGALMCVGCVILSLVQSYR